MPPMTKAQFGAFLEPMLPLFSNFRFTIVGGDEEGIIVDTETRKVVLRLTSEAQTKVGPYRNEYVFTLRVSEDGEHVDEIWEFLDSAYTAPFLGKLQQAAGL